MYFCINFTGTSPVGPWCHIKADHPIIGEPVCFEERINSGLVYAKFDNGERFLLEKGHICEECFKVYHYGEGNLKFCSEECSHWNWIKNTEDQGD